MQPYRWDSARAAASAHATFAGSACATASVVSCPSTSRSTAHQSASSGTREMRDVREGRPVVEAGGQLHGCSREELQPGAAARPPCRPHPADGLRARIRERHQEVEFERPGIPVVLERQPDRADDRARRAQRQIDDRTIRRSVGGHGRVATAHLARARRDHGLAGSHGLARRVRVDDAESSPSATPSQRTPRVARRPVADHLPARSTPRRQPAPPRGHVKPLRSRSHPRTAPPPTHR